MTTDPSDTRTPDDPDADPGMKSEKAERQADQAEGGDDDSETGG